MPAPAVALDRARWAAIRSTAHVGWIDRPPGHLQNHLPVPPSRRRYLPDDRTFVGFVERLVRNVGPARDQSCDPQPGDGPDGARGTNVDRGADVLSRRTLFERHLRRRFRYASVELGDPAAGRPAVALGADDQRVESAGGTVAVGDPPGWRIHRDRGRSRSLW